VQKDHLMRACRTPLIGLLCASLSATPVWAQTPVLDLSDLVNQDSNYAQSELGKRGYVFIHTDQRGSKTWQYWWQARDRVCARVAHVDNRASSIVSVSQTDCNQYPQNTGNTSQDLGKSEGLSTGAKVAIGAAALLGVLALASSSHDRDEEKHNTPEKASEYDRGYRDGLYHHAYHDYNHSQSYVDGYNAGQQKREAETSYRSPSGKHSGQAPYVRFNDLVGMRASNLDDEMARRSFVQKGGYKSGNQAISTWWNANTRQCVNAAVSDGRVQSISPIVEGNCI
jgi:hypothetical protein